jgi:hypothetical protein
MNYASEVGVGGAIVLLALAQMFHFLKTRNNSTIVRCPVEDQIELWQVKMSNAVADGITKSLRPLFEMQSETLKSQARSLETIINTQNCILREQVRLESRQGISD